MYPDAAVAGFIEQQFVPVRVHVREQGGAFKQLGARYGVQWTPTTLVLDPDGVERYRVEGFLPADEFLPQLMLGLGHAAFAADQFDDAGRWFQQVLDTYPTSDAAAEALYWTGVSRYKANNDASALAETARQFTERYQNSPWAKKASVWRRA